MEENKIKGVGIDYTYKSECEEKQSTVSPLRKNEFCSERMFVSPICS